MKTIAMHTGGCLLAVVLLVSPSASVSARDKVSARNLRHKLSAQITTPQPAYWRGVSLDRASLPGAPEADATSTWNASVSGNWNDPTKWSSNPNFPNNGNGGVATYAAVVSATGAAYTITLAVPITVESLTISSADATISQTTGTFTATSGVTLSAGTYQLNGGTISNTTITESGTGVLSIGSNTNNLLSGVAVNGDLTLSANNAVTQIAGGTTFTTAHLSGINSDLGFAPGQTLAGTILFEGAGGGVRNVEMNGTNGTFTIGATGVIRTNTGFAGSNARIGVSQNYGGAMALTNNGLISSQVNGTTINVAPDTLTNNGTMQALNGGILTINPTSTWTNAGTLSLDATSTVNLGGTFNTTAGVGTFSNAAGGLINITGTINNTGNTLTLNSNTGSWTLNGGTFSGGTLAFANGKTLLIAANGNNLVSGVTVNGDLTLSANNAVTQIAGGATFTTAHLSGINSDLGFAPGQTLSGTILFEGAGGGVRNVEMNGTAGAFTIGATGVIRTETGFAGSSGRIGVSQNYGGLMALTNNGLISSQVNGTNINVAPNTLTNNGTMQALNGGVLNINPTSTWSNAGTISLDATSTVNLGGTFNTTAGIGTFSNTAGGLVNITGTINNTGNTLTLNSNTGSWTLNGGTFSGGTLAFANGKTLLISSNGNNLITGVTVNGDLTLSANNAVTLIGGGTTFNTAHLTGINSDVGFTPGQTLSGTILFEGAGGGVRNVEMNGTAGAFTIGAAGVIRTETGFAGSLARIGVSQNYGGAMALTNNGLISSQVNGTNINLAPDTLTNNGTMQALNGGILTINPTSTWSNAGTIGLDATSTVNLGGTFNTTAGIGTFSNTAGGLVNITGTINNTGNTLTLNSNTGSWTLSGGTFSGGTLAFANGKTLLISSNGNNLITGVTVNGDLTLSANNAVTLIGGGTTFNTAHLSGINSDLGFVPGQTVTGTILFEGAGGGVRNIEMNGTAGAFTVGATGVIRTETGFAGSLARIGVSQNYGGAMALTNNGLISSQVNATLINVASDTLTNNGTMQALNGGVLTINPTNTWTNAGTIGLDATSTVNLGGTLNATGGIGTFSNAAGGLVNITGTINNTGNTLTLDNSTGSWTLNGGTLSGGTLAYANGKTLLIGANNNNLITGVTVNGDLTLSANGAVTKIGGGTTFNTAHLNGINSDLGFVPGQTLTGTILFEGANGGARNVEMNGTAGAFTIGTTGVIRTEAGFAGSSGRIGVTQYYGGAMALTNNGLISSQVNNTTISIQPASFNNAGVLEATNGGILDIPAGYTQTAGTTRLNNGTLKSLVNNVNQTVTIAAGRLEGSGTVTADVSNAGTIAPGLLGAGHLTINGNVTLGASSNLDIDIGGPTQGTQYDLLTQAGTVALSLNGTLTLHLINGYAPSGGQMFSILDSNQALLGAFSNVINGARLTTADGLGSFQVNYGPSSAFDPTDVVLSNFIAIPEPSAIALLALGGSVLLLRRSRISKGP